LALPWFSNSNSSKEHVHFRIRLRVRGGLFFVDRYRLEVMMGRDPASEAPIASVFPLDADVRRRTHG
jgi:hypothetical protein